MARVGNPFLARMVRGPAQRNRTRPAIPCPVARPGGQTGQAAEPTERSATAMTDWDKSRLPSRHVTVGPERAPHRSYYYAMGLTEAEIAQPFVGVATCWNEAAPCNIALSRQAQSVKRGVKAAGATPREFTTITVTDGIAMGHAGMK